MVIVGGGVEEVGVGVKSGDEEEEEVMGSLEIELLGLSIEVLFLLVEVLAK